jgi:hypothetical protein
MQPPEDFNVLSRPPMEEPVDTGDMNGLVRDLMRRVRVLEERYSSIRKNIQVNEQNMIAINKNLVTENKSVNLEIADIKQAINEMKEELRLIVLELKETVKKDEFKVLQRYIQLWEPLNFVTHDEMQRYFEENKSFIRRGGKE